jgi:hypothetical protein
MTTDADRERLQALIREVAAYSDLPLTEDRVALLAAGGPILRAAEALRSVDMKDVEPAVVFRHRAGR